MWAEGQELALEHLRSIESVDPEALSIVAMEPPSGPGKAGTVTISIATDDLPRAEGGLPLRRRERLLVSIPPGFPFRPPSLYATHTRYADSPHVFWRCYLCLYQAPGTEWSAAAGMFGFIERVELWFRRAAMGELDEPGGPIHPPATMHIRADIPCFVIREDTPTIGEDPWLGLAELKVVNSRRMDVIRWHAIGDGVPDAPIAPTVLLTAETPYEYPKQAADLVRIIEERGVDRGRVYALLKIAALGSKKGQPVYFILGAPMRGIVDGPRHQHLTVWHVPGDWVDSLRLSIPEPRDTLEMTRIRGELREIFDRWIETAKVDWCWVQEARPEVTVRRDASSPMSAFHGKSVAIWGCGALGSHIAECLVRAGARRLILRDQSVVRPGVGVRQLFDDEDTCRSKAVALADRLKKIVPGVSVEVGVGDVLVDPLEESDWTEGSDLVIDATASAQVWAKLESVRRRSEHRADVVSLMVDREAKSLLVAVALEEHSGATFDVLRKVQVEVCGNLSLRGFREAFWPAEAPPHFQPEPGCSEPTFIGSEADSMAHVGVAMGVLAKAITSRGAARAWLWRKPGADDPRGTRDLVELSWPADTVIQSSDTGWEVRISSTASREMEAWRRAGERERGVDVETGGILLGQFDEACRVLWISSALGPPPDSRHASAEFICGVEGVADAHEGARDRSGGGSGYVGLWHTHPSGAPRPSPIDLRSMLMHVQNHVPQVRRSAMVILGQQSGGSAVGAFVTDRWTSETQHVMVDISGGTAPLRTTTEAEANIGLALSGGGARAMAFHLGCLRALHDLDLLSRIQVLSCVSGGAVIGAIWAYTRGSFGEFERDLTSILRGGLTRSIARQALLSEKVVASAATSIASGAPALACHGFRTAGRSLRALFRRGSLGQPSWLDKCRPPFRRWASRTDALEAVLSSFLPDGVMLTSPRRHDIDVVFNACELRTGTAFRFGSRETGSWRTGVLENNEVPVALAVAASAAFPILLPAIDLRRTFRRHGETVKRRVLLTDGGVYDNLGTTCMEPGRDPRFSTNCFSPSHLICCNAGVGPQSGHEIPYHWPSRMAASYYTTARKGQDAAYARLHAFAESGRIRGFAMPYLAQDDSRLPIRPSDLVRRELVVGYPTDFGAMSEEVIAALSLRGEQLTRTLILAYCPSL